MTSIDHFQHVLASNTTAHAGTCDLGGVDPVLGEQLADHGREHQRIGPAVGRSGGSGCRFGDGGRCRNRSWCRGRCWSRSRCRGLRHRRFWRRRRRNRSRFRCRCRCRNRRRGGRLSGRRRSRGGGLVADHGQTDADLHRLTLGNKDLGQYAGGRRGHFGVDLVRRYFEERLVAGDRVADGLHPSSDCSFSHRLAQLRHRDVSQRAIPFRSVPTPSRRTLRTATGAAG